VAILMIPLSLCSYRALSSLDAATWIYPAFQILWPRTAYFEVVWRRGPLGISTPPLGGDRLLVAFGAADPDALRPARVEQPGILIGPENLAVLEVRDGQPSSGPNRSIVYAFEGRLCVAYAEKICFHPGVELFYSGGSSSTYVGMGNAPPHSVSVRRLMTLAWVPLLWPSWVLSRWLYFRVKRGRRVREGLCLSCGYDLTGNTSGMCPECGTSTGTRESYFT
jgi:hypothetical protein